jgi:hypothetical protein
MAAKSTLSGGLPRAGFSFLDSCPTPRIVARGVACFEERARDPKSELIIFTSPVTLSLK